MSEKKSRGSGRTRNYATVVYPESAPDNWQKIIEESFIPCFISPLHDKDVNPDGEPKKPHYHVVLMYGSVKSLDQVEPFIKSFGGVGCLQVSSLKGMTRYLIHMDNPDKYQYNVKDVVQLCGADFSYQASIVTDKYKVIGEMIDFIDYNDIKSYAHLLMFSKKHNPEWFRSLCDNCSYVIQEYIKSRTWSNEQNLQIPDKYLNPETGEIIS